MRRSLAVPVRRAGLAALVIQNHAARGDRVDASEAHAQPRAAQGKLGRFLGRLHPKRRTLALKLAQAPDEALGAAAFAREHRRDDGKKIELPVRGAPPSAM